MPCQGSLPSPVVISHSRKFVFLSRNLMFHFFNAASFFPTQLVAVHIYAPYVIAGITQRSLHDAVTIVIYLSAASISHGASPGASFISVSIM